MSKDKVRRSQWAVIDRCFALLLRLMRGSAEKSELLDIVREKAVQYDDSQEYSAIEKRLEEDRYRLRSWFSCEIDYDVRAKTYTLTSIDRPLLDLPVDARRGLAFLQSTFSRDDAPLGEPVRALIDRIMMVLPNQTRREIERERGLLELDLEQRDNDIISEAVWEAVRVTCSERRLLEFDYRAGNRSDDEMRTHVVEPYRYFFDLGSRHYYLEVYDLEARGPYGTIPQNTLRRLRLGWIRNPRPLPNHFPVGRRFKQYDLIYELKPLVARRGVTEHFPGSDITINEDGSALVKARSNDLFFDLRTLLHYGGNCRVIGGEEAVAQMRELVRQLAEQYPEIQQSDCTNLG